MLPKDRKLSSVLVKKVFKEGKSIFGDDLSLIFLHSKDDVPSRFGFSVSSRAAKTAIKRNRLRRKGYRSLQSLVSVARNSYVCVFVIKKDVSSLKNDEFDPKVRTLLVKAGVIESGK